MITGALVLALLAARTPTEEAKLVARFGDDYRRYMQHTNRFVPALRPGHGQ
jgi:protein-S-isoprenylcysteine O-methyltransferase Ste14